MFDVPYENVSDDLRRKAKAINFGIVYGMSSHGLGEGLSIDTKEAKLYIDKYFLLRKVSLGDDAKRNNTFHGNKIFP